MATSTAVGLKAKNNALGGVCIVKKPNFNMSQAFRYYPHLNKPVLQQGLLDSDNTDS